MHSKVLAMGLALGIAACAQGGGVAPPAPIIDSQGVDAAQYQQDLTQCQQYAQQVSVGQDAAKGTIAGGLLGAAMGAAIGAATGNPGQGAAVGAAAGGIGGGAGLAGKAMEERKKIVARCLQGRGYNVLSVR